MGSKKVRFIALYLPQYHPIPQNDEWWGKGFTEWTNTAKAKPLFKGHYQPHVPADLGFYDLRLPQTRKQQADMAREYGIEGFCYWEYWFEKGNQLLQTPFEEVLASGEPDFPFCLGWANEDWKNASWQAKKTFSKDPLLAEQKYNVEDYLEHFNHILPAFKDPRYITIDDKPVYVVYRPANIPNPKEFIDLWQNLAKQNGLKGIHFVGIVSNFVHNKDTAIKVNTNQSESIYKSIIEMGFDAVNSRGMERAQYLYKGALWTTWVKILRNIFKYNPLNTFDHKRINSYYYVEEDKWENVYPTVVPNWDRSPRSGRYSNIYTNSTPQVFEKHVGDAVELLKNKSKEHKVIFIQSWNEWGEGNHLEPDLKYGKAFLEVIKKFAFK